MGVPKVAIIAIVIIVAAPILMGYAMNITESTINEYEPNGTPVNVTQLLSTEPQYNYIRLDPYTLNSQNNFSGSDIVAYSYPNYQVFSNTYSSVPLGVAYFPAGSVPSSTYLTQRSTYQLNVNYPSTHSIDYHYLEVNVYQNVGGTQTLVGIASKVISMSYYQESSSVWRLRVSVWNSGAIAFASYANPDLITFTKYNDYQGTAVMYANAIGSPPTAYVDLAGGFTLNHYGIQQHHLRNMTIRNSMDLRDETLTLDLGSVTASSAIFSINGSRYDSTLTDTHYVEFEKTTTAGVVSWVARMVDVDSNGVHTTGETFNLYYDNSLATNNTYQIIINNGGFELRYVGSWPTTIGIANYYNVYQYSFPGLDINNPVGVLSEVKVWGESPVMRIDGATARSFYNSVIENQTYTPSDFKTNPSTTVKNLTSYGSSIVFGGVTFNVNKGNITLGTHNVSVNGMVFDSIPKSGGYSNRINGVEISTSATPSTITFNGKWAVNILTDSQTLETRTVTEWEAGHFGWDGIDQNFLIVGLLTSLGAFIGLAIYVRRTRSSIWPLMIVCGGAAVLFFIML